jgi:hypothetical protein
LRLRGVAGMIKLEKIERLGVAYGSLGWVVEL